MDKSSELNRYREYLLLLARVDMDQRLCKNLDPSDVVQQTLLDAHQKRDQFRGTTEAEKLVLQNWNNSSLAEIAEHMGRTPASVAGLLKRGLKRLRELLSDAE
jgi:DNA-directed RNA polymerase specialized sigma24 family protein